MSSGRQRPRVTSWEAQYFGPRGWGVTWTSEFSTTKSAGVVPFCALVDPGGRSAKAVKQPSKNELVTYMWCTGSSFSMQSSRMCSARTWSR